MTGVSARRWGSGAIRSRRFGVQIRISVLPLQICGVNGDCGGCCCGGLAPGLLVLFSEVYLASLWSGVPSFPKTETWRLVSVKGYVLCSGVMMAALPCQSVHVGYCGCVVVVSPWFALAIEVWRFRICRLWLLSSPSLVLLSPCFVVVTCRFVLLGSLCLEPLVSHCSLFSVYMAWWLQHSAQV